MIQDQEREELLKYRKEKLSIGKGDAKTLRNDEALEAPKKISILLLKRRKVLERDRSVPKGLQEVQEPQGITKMEEETASRATKDGPDEKNGKNEAEEQCHNTKSENKNLDHTPKETRTASILGDYSSDDDD